MEYKKYEIDRKFSIDGLFSAFVAWYGNEFYFPGESHEMWEFDCILEGSSGLTSGENIYNCGPYEIVIHQPNIFHTAWNSGKEPIRVLTVSFTVEGDESRIPFGKYILSDTGKLVTDEIVRCLIDNFKGNVEHSEDRLSDTYGHYISDLLEVILLSCLDKNEEQGVPVKDGKAALFRDVIRFMKENIDEDPDMDTICRSIGIGRTSLKELFKKYTGRSVFDYQRDLRFRRCVSLMESGMSMAEIAEIMHFSSQNYFSSYFKKISGMTPVRYKNTFLRNVKTKGGEKDE